MASLKSAVILGGGPAGCQCALWLKMLGLDTVIIEQSDKLGGLQALSPYQNNWMIGNINITGRKLAQDIERHIEQMEIPVIRNNTISQFKKQAKGFTVSVGEKEIQTHSLVIATGVKPRRHNLSEAENVVIGPGEKVFNFDFTNKRVAILGSGDNAAENYVFIKMKNPQLCHLYGRTIRARKNLWKQVAQEDIFLYPYTVDQKQMGIKHRNIMRDYDVIVVMFGWQANFPKALTPLKIDLLNEQGFMETDAYCRTPIPGIYAIGEIANRMHPCVITSMADGIVAAKAIHQELEDYEK